MIWAVIGILIKILIVVGITRATVAYLIWSSGRSRPTRRTGSGPTVPAGSSASRSACSSRWPTGPRCSSRKT